MGVSTGCVHSNMKDLGFRILVKFIPKLLMTEQELHLEIVQDMVETMSSPRWFPLESYQVLHNIWCSSIKIFLQFCLSKNPIAHTSSFTSGLPLSGSFCRWRKNSHMHIRVTYIRAANHISIASFAYTGKIKVWYFLNKPVYPPFSTTEFFKGWLNMVTDDIEWSLTLVSIYLT